MGTIEKDSLAQRHDAFTTQIEAARIPSALADALGKLTPCRCRVKYRTLDWHHKTYFAKQK
jgi:hypothetical protein